MGADLVALTKEAAALAIKRMFEQIVGYDTKSVRSKSHNQICHWPLKFNDLSNMFITIVDFTLALKKVQPSMKREGFTTIPNVTWHDVGSLEKIREELDFTFTRPIHNPESYEKMGLDPATGVLLYGPPG